MTTWMELENTMLNEICQEQIPTLPSAIENTEEQNDGNRKICQELSTLTLFPWVLLRSTAQCNEQG